MTTKHTPAPWKVNTAISKTDYEIWAAGTPKIATVHDRNVSSNEHNANAFLIAAAPELLEILQDICKYGQASNLGFDAYNQLDHADVLSKRALAVIAKATA
jgi:hypothetical protein